MNGDFIICDYLCWTTFFWLSYNEKARDKLPKLFVRRTIYTQIYLIHYDRLGGNTWLMVTFQQQETLLLDKVCEQQTRTEKATDANFSHWGINC